uniref:Cyclin dependent kinase inhibitor 1A n=1 Tax=Sphenodon punctatus TaxID=8508 RepID=A0A8D0H146_SPHPU
MPLSQSNIRQAPCSKKLCRNLFGPVDHEQLQSDFQDLMRQQLQEAQCRWNFDFETETPLEGNFKWERVWCVDVPPARMSSRDPLGHPKGSSSTGEKSASPRVHFRLCANKDLLDLPLLNAAAQPGSEVGKPSSPRSLKRKQTSMKDFYSSKRRSVPCKPDP